MNEAVIHVKADNDVKGGLSGALRDIETFGKSVVVTSSKAGLTAAGAMSDNISKGLQQAGPVIGSALAVGAVAAAPAVASLISAAVVGGAGAGGVVGGLALAAKDPRVADAGSKLGEQVMSSLEQKAQVFVEPALEGIAKLKLGFGAIGPELTRIFSDSSRYVRPLVDGLISGGQKAIGGFADAVSQAGPIMNQLGDSFDQIGGAIGDAFTKLSQDSEDGASSLQGLTDTIVGTISATTDLVAGLTKVHSALEGGDEKIDSWRHKLEDFLSIGDVAGAQFDITADGMSNMERRAKDAADAQGELSSSVTDTTGALEDQANSLQSVSDSLTEATDPMFTYFDALDRVNSLSRDYNKVVKKHGENSLEAFEAQLKMNKATVAYVAAAAKASNGTGHLTDEQKALLRSAGTSRKEIKRLDDALYAAYVQAKDLDGFRVDITYAQHFKMFGKPYSQAAIDTGNIGGLAHGGIQGAANGGIRSNTVMVGEHGPELVELAPGSRVHSNPDSMRMLGVEGYAKGGAIGNSGPAYDKWAKSLTHGTIREQASDYLGYLRRGNWLWEDFASRTNQNDDIENLFWDEHPNGWAWSKANAPKGSKIVTSEMVQNWLKDYLARGQAKPKPAPASSGGSGGQPILVQVVLNDKVLAEQLVSPFRNMVRAQGAGSAQQFWGQR